MWEFGRYTWQISVRRWELLLDGALWVRDAERIEVPLDRLVPGPLDIDPDLLPPPTTTDPRLGPQWLDWWHSLIDPTIGERPRPPEPSPQDPPPQDPLSQGQPAYGTPDPLGLARRPQLAEVVARRWDEATAWQLGRVPPVEVQHLAVSTSGTVVRQVEQAAGRPVQPFRVEFMLLPVRDVFIRRVRDHRYLVPECVFDGRGWRGWLRGLITDVGYPASGGRRV